MDSTTEVDVTITYCHVGTTPPLFVAGSFTTPPWIPEELDHCSASAPVGDSDTDNSETDYIFSKTFKIPEGTYQYKFRVGHAGDWWVCDEKVPTTTDGAGNHNNLLMVKAAKVSHEAETQRTQTFPSAENVLSDSPVSNHGAQLISTDVKCEDEGLPEDLTKMTIDEEGKDRERNGDGDQDSASEEGMSLEDRLQRRMTHLVVDYTDLPKLADDEEPDWDAPEFETTPLFTHEMNLADQAVEQTARNSKDSSGSGSSKAIKYRSSGPDVPKEADLNDPSLLSFPTTRQGVYEGNIPIMDRLPEDDGCASDEDDMASQSATLAVPNPTQGSSNEKIAQAALDPINEGHEEAEDDGMAAGSVHVARAKRYGFDGTDDSDIAPEIFLVDPDSVPARPHNRFIHSSVCTDKHDPYGELDNVLDVLGPDHESEADSKDRLGVEAKAIDEAGGQLYPINPRPLSPSSKTGLENRGNFIQVFLHVVFVEWLGTFFATLCGRRRSHN